MLESRMPYHLPEFGYSRKSSGGHMSCAHFISSWLNANPVVHGSAKALLASQVLLCRLH